MRVMSKPRSEIDESSLRALLRHTSRDIAHSRKPMLRLARGGLTGLLMSASVVVGLAGLFWLLLAIFSMANGVVYGFPLGLGGVVCGLTLFAVGVGLMRLARGPDRARDQASKGRVRVARRALSTLLLVVSIVVVYAGASGLIFALVSFFAHHSDPQGVSQVAWGIPELAIGLGGMQAARYLRRR
jgi:hypothetical protein